jgi:hypothetical protein
MGLLRASVPAPSPRCSVQRTAIARIPDFGQHSLKAEGYDGGLAALRPARRRSPSTLANRFPTAHPFHTPCRPSAAPVSSPGVGGGSEPLLSQRRCALLGPAQASLPSRQQPQQRLRHHAAAAPATTLVCEPAPTQARLSACKRSSRQAPAALSTPADPQQDPGELIRLMCQPVVTALGGEGSWQVRTAPHGANRPATRPPLTRAAPLPTHDTAAAASCSGVPITWTCAGVPRLAVGARSSGLCTSRPHGLRAAHQTRAQSQRRERSVNLLEEHCCSGCCSAAAG